MKNVSIKLKLIVLTALGVVAVAAVVSVTVDRIYQAGALHEAQETVEHAAHAFADLEASDAERMSAAMEAIKANPEIRKALAERDREKLLALSSPIFEKLRAEHGITHWYYLEGAPSATVLLRVHHPPLHGDTVNRITFRKALQTGRPSSGKELGKTAFALRVVKPIPGEDGKVLGFLELGEEIDHFLGEIARHTGAEFAMVLDKKFLDGADWASMRASHGLPNDWDEFPELITVNATADKARFGLADANLATLEEVTLLPPREIQDRTFARGVFPVRDVTGQKVGAVFVLWDITVLRAATDLARLKALAAVVLVAAALLALALFLLERVVFRRLHRLIETMEILAGGDFAVAEKIKPDAMDEIGRFEDFLAQFLRAVGGTFRMIQSEQETRERPPSKRDLS